MSSFGSVRNQCKKSKATRRWKQINYTSRCILSIPRTYTHADLPPTSPLSLSHPRTLAKLFHSSSPVDLYCRSIDVDSHHSRKSGIITTYSFMIHDAPAIDLLSSHSSFSFSYIQSHSLECNINFITHVIIYSWDSI